MTIKTTPLAMLSILLLAAGCAQLPEGESTAPAPLAMTVLPVVQPAPTIVPDVAPVLPAVEPLTTAAAIPTPPRDLWERIRNGFSMQPMDTQRVTQWENYYASKPEFVALMVERSSLYLYHIVEEIERRKMPAEIALLPMIESAYNPQAYSRAHASGLWQFIPSTGKLYGLRQNWWYDGRRDVIAATNAALDYLEKLHLQFGDWELALASYNWGEGAVSHAIERNQAKGLPTDYGSLRMPAETRNYLPKLIAMKNIISDPARFNIQLAQVPNEPYFATVTVEQHIDVKLAAKFAEMSLDEFRFLNPAHNKSVIKAGAAESIVLPVDKVSAFHTNLQNYDEPLVSWQAHTVQRGESPEKIAAKYGISVAALKQVNGIGGRNKFRTGLPLLVPVKAGAAPNLPDLPATPVTLTRAYKAARNKNSAKKTTDRSKVTIKAAANSTTKKKTPSTVVAAQDQH